MFGGLESNKSQSTTDESPQLRGIDSRSIRCWIRVMVEIVAVIYELIKFGEFQVRNIGLLRCFAARARFLIRATSLLV